MIRTVGVVLVLAIAPAMGVAQEMSDEELARLFEEQRDALKAVSSPNGQARGLRPAPQLGATRGLKLVAIDNPEASSQERGVRVTSAASAEVETETATAEVTAEPAATEVTAASASPAEVTYASFAPEYQINVRITFDLDSAALRDDQKPQLDQLCRVMRVSDIEKFRVVGHTDATGSETYNQRLSRLRAEEVQRFFVEDCGIAGTRIEAIGVGERFPFDDQDPVAAENRRVEFQALS